MPAAASGDTGYAVNDGKSVYLLDAGNLWRVPIAGGSPVKLVPAESNYGFASGPMVVDDTSVYLLASGGQAIVKVAK
jgi:hypothetical protein